MDKTFTKTELCVEIELIFEGLSNSDNSIKKASFNAFYKLYSRWLYDICYRNCNRFPGYNSSELIMAVFNNTMVNVYEKGQTFNPNFAEKSVDALCKAWLSAAARNELNALLGIERKWKEQNEEFDSNLHVSHSVINDDDEFDEIPLSENAKHLQEALQTLSDRDRDVLLTLTQYSEGKKHKEEKVRKQLCSYYSTTEDNLRQIYSRSKRKITEILQHKIKNS